MNSQKIVESLLKQSEVKMGSQKAKIFSEE